MNRFHPIRIMCVLAAGIVASACAGYHYAGASSRAPGVSPGATINIEIVDDAGNRCRKKAGPDGLYGMAGKPVTWHIVNSCKQTITVRVHTVKEKHTTFGGTYPFAENDIKKESIAPGASYDLTATVLASNQVPMDAKGFHVYRYKFKIQPGIDEDPEIIIEWP